MKNGFTLIEIMIVV
ncbi:prepilin-type N-terminal cleavage/methylation domain-containing protein, partial [Acinetobacter baumannii]